MIKVLYPGSFDPITYGHMNIIKQSCYLFDEVVIAIMRNPNKGEGFFNLKERYDVIRELYSKMDNVSVILGEGAAVDVALSNGCKAIIRGLRGLTDYDYEVQMNQINLDMCNSQVRTVPLFADKEYQFLSSSIVREVFSLNKDISLYVDPFVQEKMLVKKKCIR